MAKSIYRIQHKQKKQMQKEMVTIMEKALQKLMNNAMCSKTMENLKNRIDVRLVSNDIKTKLHVIKNI